MLHTWKLLPLAVLAAFGLLMIGPSGTQVAQADIDEVTVEGDVVPDGDTVNVDDGDYIDVEVSLTNDHPTSLRIRAIAVGTDSAVSIEFLSCDDNSRESSDDCRVDGDGTANLVVSDPSASDPGLQRVTVLIDVTCDEQDSMLIWIEETGGDESYSFDLDCGFGTPTPTATATTTVGPAATINISSAYSNLGCGATSIVTITVRDNGGGAVAGTLVNIAANQGSVSPASEQTADDGSFFVFYIAPSNTGGKATITAASGSALGTTEIDINCNLQPTQAPPPTTAPPGIQPPNTGDAGLSASNNSWQTYAGVALIVASVIGTLAVIRPRA